MSYVAGRSADEASVTSSTLAAGKHLDVGDNGEASCCICGGGECLCAWRFFLGSDLLFISLTDVEMLPRLRSRTTIERATSFRPDMGWLEAMIGDFLAAAIVVSPPTPAPPLTASLTSDVSARLIMEELEDLAAVAGFAEV